MVEIEAAYDILFMRSMKKRITGELEVSTAVRYADVPTQRKASPKPPVSAFHRRAAATTFADERCAGG